MIIERLIYFRQTIITVIKRFEAPILYALRFIMGLFVFSALNGYFTSLGTGYAERLDSLSVVLLASVITAIVPPTWFFMLIWLFITLHIFYISLELSVIVGLLLLCLIFFYIRIFPRESHIIILLLLCFKLKIPYFAVLIAGLFAGVPSVGALIIGSLLWTLSPHKEIYDISGSTLTDINVLSLPQSFGDTLKSVIDLLTGSNEWIQYALVFAVAALAVFIIARLSIPYSMEVALGAGGLALIVGMLMSVASGGLNISILGVIASVIVSAALAYICKFFYIITDYGSTERVSFQDDDYLYYVKAVPKIK